MVRTTARRRIAPTLPREGQPDRGPGRGAAAREGVAGLVAPPQPVAAGRGALRAAPGDERVGDPPAIAGVEEHRAGLGPDPERAAAPAVAHAVAGYLVAGEYE